MSISAYETRYLGCRFPLLRHAYISTLLSSESVDIIILLPLAKLSILCAWTREPVHVSSLLDVFKITTQHRCCPKVKREEPIQLAYRTARGRMPLCRHTAEGFTTGKISFPRPHHAGRPTLDSSRSQVPISRIYRIVSLSFSVPCLFGCIIR